MAEVVLSGVRKVFDRDIVAVRDFTLSVADGEFVVLVGPSGCGKSTTLRMIAGLEKETAGEIVIDGVTAHNLPPKDRDIAMVFQNYALYPHMTVFENMAFGLKLRKFPKVEIEERVKEAADILGIESLLDRRPEALSGGQRQRVAVGRSIVRKPKVFLFDEPLSNLDAKLRVQMRTEISKLHVRLDATMIYVTHDQVEAMTMGDRLVVMCDGDIQQIGAPADLYRFPINRFVAGFIGSPSMNFVEGSLVQGDDLAFELGALRFTLPAQIRDRLVSSQASKVALGIRSEDIHEASAVDHAAAEVTVDLDVVEPMGSETYVYFQLAGTPFVARLGGNFEGRVGQPLRLAIDLAAVHLFDAETGVSLLKAL